VANIVDPSLIADLFDCRIILEISMDYSPDNQIFRKLKDSTE